MEYIDVHNSSVGLEKELQNITTSSMSNKQKERIKKFVSDLGMGKAGKKVKDRRMKNYILFLAKLHVYFKKDIDSITEKEAEDFYKALQDNKIKRQNGEAYSQATKDEYVKTLKRYLGWAWGNKTTKYRKSISWMKEDYKKSDKNAITLKQAEEIIKKESVFRNKVLFMFLFDSGARIEETLNTRVMDFTNGKFLKVHIRGQKTEEADRTIAIPLAAKYVNTWLKEFQNPEDFIFPVRYDNARKIVRIMSKRVLGYQLKPHELRHSSATHYIQFGGFGAENIGGFYYRYGWKFGSKEALTYIKTYLYSGDIGQEKVIRAIESSKIDELEQENERMKAEIRKIQEMIVQGLNKIQKRKTGEEDRWLLLPEGVAKSHSTYKEYFFN